MNDLKEMTKRENLVYIGFWFKNDKPGGLGLTFQEGKTASPRAIQKICESSHMNFLRTIKELGREVVVNRTIKTLEELGKMKPEERTSPEIMMLAFTGIYSMTLIGAIAEDEYNGLSVGYKQ